MQPAGHHGAIDGEGRIPAIEGLRAYLAWWVVAFHILITAWHDIPEMGMPFALIGAGGHAVTVFMIVSGFVIFRLFDLRHEPYLQYIVRRFLRIYPVFVTSGAATGLFILAVSLSEAESFAIWPLQTLERYLIRADIVFDNALLHVLLNAVMLQGIPSESLLPLASFSFNPAAWSLSLEWQFYLIAPALFLAWRIPAFGPVLLALIVAAIFRSSAVAGPHPFPSFLPLSIHWFALGMMSWVIYRSRHRPGMLKLLIVTAAGTSAIAIARCFDVVPDRPTVYADNTAIPVAVWMTFLTLLIVRERTNGICARVFGFFFESCLILALGRCSYSTYLWHRVILWLVMIGMAELLDSVDPWTLICASTPLFVLLVLAASFASYRYIEAPPIAFARRIGQRSAAQRACAASAA